MSILTVLLNGKTVTEEFNSDEQPVLSTVLERTGVNVIHPCGGRGICCKCAVKITGELSAPTEKELQLNVRLACRTRLLGDCVLDMRESNDETAVIETEGIKRESALPETSKSGLGIAVDVGTTTVVVGLFDMKTGERLSAASEINPQTSVASDVMGRIKASMEGKRDFLAGLIRDSVSRLTQECLLKAGKSELPVYGVITGNTTMLYCFNARDPVSLSAFPFKADCLFDCEEDYNGKTLYFPPCISAFVGADITCAVEASGMIEKGETALLCDIGTNGEIALFKDGRLFVTSTAAGPAFEGAGISCGCEAVAGAIDTVKYSDGKIVYTTIGDKPPVGLCGSGIIDAVAAFLDAEYIDETGVLDGDGMISDNIRIIQQDIRAVQLAKAAISAGIETLVSTAGCSFDSIKTLYIAGGFGKHLNVESAVRIGLLPSSLRNKVKVIGNAAFSGAVSALLNDNSKQKLRDIVGIADAVNLGGNKEFNEKYVDNMFFE